MPSPESVVYCGVWAVLIFPGDSMTITRITVDPAVRQEAKPSVILFHGATAMTG